MKKLLILACTLAIGTAAYAAPAKAAPKAAPKAAHFSGTIERYDPGTHTLTVKHDGKDTTFQVNDKSQVMNGSSKADASALAASSGHGVKIDYMMEGTTRTAAKIEVSAAHPAAPKKK